MDVIVLHQLAMAAFTFTLNPNANYLFLLSPLLSHTHKKHEDRRMKSQVKEAKRQHMRAKLEPWAEK